MTNTIQLFGLVLIGGLLAGEVSRRLAGLPRTTGFVMFGLLSGQSGLGWISPLHIESAQLFVDLGLGLILFELGSLVPRTALSIARDRLFAGLNIAGLSGLAMFALLFMAGYSAPDALFASALCLATSAAITIATCSDVGAKGERSGLLYTMVALNGCLAFTVIAVLMPFLDTTTDSGLLARLASALGTIAVSLLIGAACAAVVLFGARRLERQPEHHHLLILGCIVAGVGSAVQLEISVFLPMLIFGYLVHAFDHQQRVIGIRIASDARVFLVITFVLAGAALDIAHLQHYWPQALAIAGLRLGGQWLASWLNRRRLGLSSSRECLFLAIGLQPMSSVALVLLSNTQVLYAELDPELVGALLATLLLMQLFGPLATQTAIKGFGEATRLSPKPSPGDTTLTHGGNSP